MKNTLLLVILGSIVEIAGAQVADVYKNTKIDPLSNDSAPFVLPPQKDTEKRQDRIIRKEQLDDSQRKRALNGVEKVPEGYLKIRGQADYINLPSDFPKHPKFMKSSGLAKSPAQNSSLQFLGSLKEDDYRTDWQFKYKNFDATLTIWRYKEAGATITILEDFLTQTVQGVPAALTLSQAEKSTKVLWKLTWWKDGVCYEFYLNDVLDRNNKPSMSSKEILNAAQFALSNAKS